MTTKEIILSVNSGDAEKSIKDLRTNIGTLRNALVGLDRTSEDYSEVLQEIAKRQTELNQINQDARNVSLNLEQQLNNVVRIGGSLAAGYSAVTAAGTLLGTNSEALDKVFVKLQASMALVQGVKGLSGLQNTIPAVIAGIKNFTVAFRALDTVMRTSVIGAIALVITGIVLAFNSLTGSAKRSEEELKRVEDRVRGLRSEFDYFNNTLQYNIRLWAAQGLSVTESLTKQKEALKKEADEIAQRLRDDRAGRIKLSSEEQQELIKQREELSKRISNIRKEQDIEEAKADTDATKRAIDEARKRKEEVEKIERSAVQTLATSLDDRLKLLEYNYNKQVALYEQQGKDISNIQQVYLLEVDNLIKEDNEKRLKTINDNFSRELDTISFQNEQRLSANTEYVLQLEAQLNEAELYLAEIQNTKDEELKISAEEKVMEAQLRIQEALTDEILITRTFYDEQIDLLNDLLENELLVGDRRVEAEREVQRLITESKQLEYEYINQTIQNETKALQNQQKTEAAITKNRIAIQNSYLNSFSQIASAATQIIGEETAAGKAIAVAGATIDTYKAGTSAFASTPGGVIPKSIALAATVAQGIATVKKILSTEVPNETTVSTPSISNVSNAVEVPQAEVEEFYDPRIERPEYFQESTEEREVNNRVYVLETDITDVISKVNTVESKSGV